MATAVALAAGVRAGWARSRWYAVRLGPVALIVLDSTRVADPAQGRVLDQLVENR